MYKKIKGKLLFLFLVSLSFLFLFLAPVAASKVYAEESGTEAETAETEEYLYEKFPIVNYSLDSYVDTSGNWLPWNWLKAGGDVVFFVLKFIVNIGVLINFYISDVIGMLMEEVYSLDIITGLVGKVAGFTKNLAGIDGGWLSTGLFPQLLTTIILINGLYLCWLMVKRDTGQIFSTILKFMGIIVFSIVFISNTRKIVKAANEVVTDVQDAILVSINDSLGMSGEPGKVVRDGFFELTVYKPYLMLQYGTVEVEEKTAFELLALKPDSDARNAIVKTEKVERGNEMMNSWSGLTLRILNLTLVGCSNLCLGIVLIVMGAMVIYHQLAFLFYLCMTPYALIVGALPGKSRVIWNLLGKMVYELSNRIMVTFLISLLFVFSNFLYSEVSGSTYIVICFIQVVLYLFVFIKRKELYSLVLGVEEKAQKSGLIQKLNRGLTFTARTKYLRNSLGRAGAQRNKKISSPNKYATRSYQARASMANRLNVDKARPVERQPNAVGYQFSGNTEKMADKYRGNGKGIQQRVSQVDAKVNEWAASTGQQSFEKWNKPSKPVRKPLRNLNNVQKFDFGRRTVSYRRVAAGSPKIGGHNFSKGFNSDHYRNVGVKAVGRIKPDATNQFEKPKRLRQSVESREGLDAGKKSIEENGKNNSFHKDKAVRNLVGRNAIERDHETPTYSNVTNHKADYRLNSRIDDIHVTDDFDTEDYNEPYVKDVARKVSHTPGPVRQVNKKKNNNRTVENKRPTLLNGRPIESKKVVDRPSRKRNEKR